MARHYSLLPLAFHDELRVLKPAASHEVKVAAEAAVISLSEPEVSLLLLFGLGQSIKFIEPSEASLDLHLDQSRFCLNGLLEVLIGLVEGLFSDVLAQGYLW